MKPVELDGKKLVRYPHMKELVSMAELKSQCIVVAGGSGLHLVSRTGELHYYARPVTLALVDVNSL